MEEWSKDLHIIRHGYHGRSYNGNNSKRILDNCERLREAFGFECYPAVDALKALGEVCSGEKKQLRIEATRYTDTNAGKRQEKLWGK